MFKFIWSFIKPRIAKLILDLMLEIYEELFMDSPDVQKRINEIIKSKQK